MRRLLVVLAMFLGSLAAGPSTLPAAAAEADPLRPMQWGLDQIRAPAAYARTTGAGITIAVIDSGVDRNHPDLRDKLAGGATFFGCPTASSCGNGHWTDGGGVPHPHGTHVSGIAAASTGDGFGVAGTAPSAALLPIKAGDAEGLRASDVARAIRYSIGRAQVINLSIGNLPGSQFVDEPFFEDATPMITAIGEAIKSGIVVVASSGNESSPLCSEPAYSAGVLCVVATDRAEAKSFYSNTGEKLDRLVVTAPGGSGLPACEADIVSSVPLGAGANPQCGYGVDHDEMAGTSMASPHVAGVAALLMSQGRNRQQTLDALTSTARQPLTNTRGVFTPAFGWGIVDADAATKVPVPAATAAQGYWLGAGDGAVFSFGSASFHGAANGQPLERPVVGLSASPTGGGYWLVAEDGGIFAFGDAAFHGSTGGMRLNRPIVGMASTPSGNGYWLVASDGGIFAFGDAAFHGSTGGMRLNRPIVGMASTPSGDGYWFVASDGGIFAFGDAGFHGSTGDLRLKEPVTGMAATGSGRGYWFVAADGGVFTFGDARFAGSASGKAGAQVVGMGARA